MKSLLSLLAIGLAGCASMEGPRFARTAPLKPVTVVSKSATQVKIRKEPMGRAVSEVPIQLVGNERHPVAGQPGRIKSQSEMNPPVCRRIAP